MTALPPVWPTRLALAGLALVWAGASFRIPFHAPAFVALCLVLLVARRWKAAAILLLLSPPMLMVLMAGSGYTQGRASLRYVGLPGTGFHNLDPDLRVGRETMGDLVTGDEWLYILPSNATVRLLVATLGPMPGAYTGPYPGRDTVFSELERARPIPAGRFLEDVVVLDGREIRLDTGVGRGLVANGLGWDTGIPAEVDTVDPIQATLFEERCLILRIPELWRLPDELLDTLGLEERPARIALVDIERGRPFAYFAPKAGPGHRYPPVRWLK